jgi:hypothetical protein
LAQRAVIPLRAIRRALKAPGMESPALKAPALKAPALKAPQLKAPQGLVEAGTVEAFRTRIKAVELEAERLQQEAMYDLVRVSLLGEPAPSVADAARHNVTAYESICAAAFAQPAVDVMLDALAKP